MLGEHGESFKLQKSKYQSEQGNVHRREYLEKSVITLEKSLERRVLQLNQAIERARNQSGQLLAFSNLMRRENKELKQKLRDYKYQLAVKKEKLKEIADNLFGQKM